MKWLILVAVVGLMLVFSGCLTVGYLETHIQFQEKDEPATVTSIYRGISSGEADLDDVRKDFESLIEDWNGDDYLLDRALEGFFVKSRDVYVENGEVVGRVIEITKDVSKFYPMWVSNGERILLLEVDKDMELVESNGEIFTTARNTLIVWPEQVQALYIKQRLTDLGESHEKNRPVMVKMLEEYLAENE